MGYYTVYNLSIVEGDDSLISELREESDSANYAIEDDGTNQDSSKRYDHEDELKAFSLKHPQTLFKLEGDGEEKDDLWIKYFQNGKCQTCNAKFVFNNFDVSKLI